MDCSTPGSMGFSRQEYRSRLLFLSPGDLSYPGIERGPASLAGGFFTTDHQGSMGPLLKATKISPQVSKKGNARLPKYIEGKEEAAADESQRPFKLKPSPSISSLHSSGSCRSPREVGGLQTPPGAGSPAPTLGAPPPARSPAPTPPLLHWPTPSGEGGPSHRFSGVGPPLRPRSAKQSFLSKELT